MAYNFAAFVALAPETGELARNTRGQVFAADDGGLTSPLTVTIDGIEVTEIPVGPQGVGTPFTSDEPIVLFKSSGAPAISLASLQHLADAAVAAADDAELSRIAAELAAANAVAPTDEAIQDALGAAVADPESAVSTSITGKVDGRLSEQIDDEESDLNASYAAKPTEQVAATARQAVADLAVNVKDAAYGATGDGTTDDTTAIQAAIDAAGAGSVFFPAGTYLVSGDGLTVSAHGLTMYGPGREKTTIQSATGNVLTISGRSQFVSGLDFRSQSGGGHCVVVPTTKYLSQSHFTACSYTQRNDDRSCWYYNDPSEAGNGGFIDCHWSDSVFQHKTTATVPGFYVYGTSGICFAANRFHRVRAHSSGTFFFDIRLDKGSVSNYNNTWDTINFEVCDGGGVRLWSAHNTGLHNLGFFDNHDNIHGNLIEVGRTGTNTKSTNTRITNMHRSGGTLAGDAVDVLFTSGSNGGSSIIDGISGPASAGVTVDVGAGSGNVIIIGYHQTDVTINNRNTAGTVLIAADAGIETPKLKVGGKDISAVDAASATALGNAGHSINTTNKFLGRPAWSSAAARPIWAAGGAPTSSWVFADGTVAYTPT